MANNTRTSLITSGRHPELLQKAHQINKMFQQFNLPGAPERAVSVRSGRIGLLARQEDFECCILGGLGFTTETISRRTGLSHGQISYRLKAAGISRAAYRQGRSAFALSVFENVARKAANLVEVQCRLMEAKSAAHSVVRRKGDVIDVGQ